MITEVQADDKTGGKTEGAWETGKSPDTETAGEEACAAKMESGEKGTVWISKELVKYEIILDYEYDFIL